MDNALLYDLVNVQWFRHKWSLIWNECVTFLTKILRTPELRNLYKLCLLSVNASLTHLHKYRSICFTFLILDPPSICSGRLRHWPSSTTNNPTHINSCPGQAYCPIDPTTDIRAERRIIHPQRLSAPPALCVFMLIICYFDGQNQSSVDVLCFIKVGGYWSFPCRSIWSLV